MLAEGSQTIITFQHINSFTPRSDQFVISSYNIKTWLSKKGVEKKKVYQLGIMCLISYQILGDKTIRSVW